MEFRDVVDAIKRGEYDPAVEGDVVEFYCLEADYGVNPPPRRAKQLVETESKNPTYGRVLGEAERAFSERPTVTVAASAGWILSMPVPTNVRSPAETDDVIPVSHPKYEHVTDYRREFGVRTDRALWHVDTKWVVDVPDGYSVYYAHPFNHSTETFTVVPGVIDVDQFPYWFRVPVCVNVDHGAIEYNDPLVQLLPFERSEEPVRAEIEGVESEGARAAVVDPLERDADP